MDDPKKTAPEAKARHVCMQEVRFGDKTYGVGDKLPADIDADIVKVLKAHGAI